MEIKKTSRKQLFDILEDGSIAQKNIDSALMLTGIIPTSSLWRTFIDTLMLWLGMLSLAFSMLFFIAYNWTEMGRFAQFFLVEVAMVTATTVYYRADTHKPINQIALLVASILLGVLLALFGQTYQTGADTWQLFFTWAVLMTPWAIIARSSVLWMLWIGLLNLSIYLYFNVKQHMYWTLFDTQETYRWYLFVFNTLFDTQETYRWYLFGFNTLMLLTWELLSRYKTDFVADIWVIRMLTILASFSITWLVVIGIVEPHTVSLLPTFVWVLYLASLYVIYKNIKQDLFILTTVCLSGIVVIMTFSKHLLSGFHADGFFLLAFIIVGLGAASAYWLKNLHKRWQV